MLKFVALSAAILCSALSIAAQESAPAFDASPASEPASPAPLIPADREAWQLGVGFRYLHFNVLGTSFHEFGYQADVTRYLTNWFGVEGAVTTGFGHTGSSPRLDANSLFLGGGSHFALYSASNFEPWAHVLVGWERFRFTQTATLGANSHIAFYAGGGVDYKIRGGRLYWRVQGDYIGARFTQSLASDYAFGTGFVVNF